MFLGVVLFVAVSLSSAAADTVGSERSLLELILHCSQRGASSDAVCPDACRRWPQYCYYAIAAEHGVPGTCKLPPYPRVGGYIIEALEVARAGHLADFTLLYTCPPGSKLTGYHPSCVSGTWNTDFPSCTSVFCKLTPHPSVTYYCTVTDPNNLSGYRKCNDFEPSGTEIHPRCNDNYYHNGVLSYMYCIDGSWDNVATCEPECGTLTPNGVPLVINGVSAKRSELPWHAGIYDKRYTPFMQICGGSLVSTTVIISVAHCFWDDVERLLPAKYYAVGVGKLFRSWNIDEGQKSDVSQLKVPPRFLGAGNNFQDDIALVILVTPVVLTNYVRPVCIDFNALFDDIQLQPGNVGKVAGWGLTSQYGNASQVLKVAELPYVGVEQCIANLPFDFRSYITSDKICAGTRTGSALCKGDSGGGLVFPEVERSVQRWYLRGLVSTAPSNGHECNANSYTSFTQLLKHADFVRKHLKQEHPMTMLRLPECGTITPNGEPLVINGVSAKRGELPWYAGIYDNRYMPFMQICGGSLVSTTVIISVAHCFWDDVEGLLPAKYYAVAVGKLFRSWNIDEGGQKSDVSQLKVPPRFLGAGNNFQDDIALVILVTPVVLTNYVRPVCIDFNALFDDIQLQPGNVGKVAGWGLTSQYGNASQVLKVAELPYVGVEQCIANLPFDFRSYITSDKICAGTKTGSALCKGDSGGGLVFPEVERSVQRWYLRGLVSTAPSNGHECNANSYTSFTQLLKHADFVRKHLKL